jgi:eukaryotic-like serine/threonine-protein kinase
MPTHASSAAVEPVHYAESSTASARASWFGRVIRGLNPKPAGNAGIESDPLLAFASERPTEDKAPAPAAPIVKSRSHASWWVLAASLAIVLTAAAAFAVPQIASLRASAAASQTGKLTIVTRPTGASVTVDAQPAGATPLTLSISAGAHTVTIRSGANERVLPVTVAAGADIVRDLEMGPADSALAPGALSVTTDPPGARVTIDGAAAGTSPITVEALTAEPHTVVVTGATGSAERTVTVAAGHTSMVVFSLPKVSGPVGGWLSVAAPFDVQVIEKDEVIGAGGAAKVMMAAGRHDIALANRALDYQETRHVEIAAGGTTTIRVDPPKVTLSVNARPWADVSLDGADIGQTPIANATAAVGTHQLVFRHPQLGERRQSVVVTGKGPNRIAVDLTK